jgi:hypothetical protein
LFHAWQLDASRANNITIAAWSMEQKGGGDVEDLEDLLLTRGCAEISDDSTPQRTLGYDTKLTLILEYS